MLRHVCPDAALAYQMQVQAAWTGNTFDWPALARAAELALPPRGAPPSLGWALKLWPPALLAQRPLPLFAPWAMEPNAAGQPAWPLASLTLALWRIDAAVALWAAVHDAQHDALPHLSRRERDSLRAIADGALLALVVDPQMAPDALAARAQHEAEALHAVAAALGAPTDAVLGSDAPVRLHTSVLRRVGHALRQRGPAALGLAGHARPPSSADDAIYALSAACERAEPAVHTERLAAEQAEGVPNACGPGFAAQAVSSTLRSAAAQSDARLAALGGPNERRWACLAPAPHPNGVVLLAPGFCAAAWLRAQASEGIDAFVLWPDPMRVGAWPLWPSEPVCVVPDAHAESTWAYLPHELRLLREHSPQTCRARLRHVVPRQHPWWHIGVANHPPAQKPLHHALCARTPG